MLFRSGYYLVMKYLEGESLDAYVLRKAAQSEVLPINQVVALLARVAVALDYAHQNGVIHRDIKPSNIFLVKSGGKLHVQIIDFGLADEIRTSMSKVSQVQIEVSGTRPYMAPEQWRGSVQSSATDQYALAVVAYELLTGRLPFKGSDVGVLRLAVMNDTPDPIPTISDSANAALQKAMAKDAADRFATCREFMSALGGAWTTVAAEEPAEVRTAKVPFSLADPSSYFATPLRMIGLAGCFLLLFLLGAIVWSTNTTKPLPSTEIELALSPTLPASLELAPGISPLTPATPASPPQTRPATPSPTPSPPTPSPQTPIEWRNIFLAAQRGTVDDVRFLLDSGENVNRKDRHGYTPLHHAMSNRNEGQIEIVQYLISQGAEVTAEVSGWTPLHGAAYHRANIEVLVYLISQDAKVNALGGGGRTPLDVAGSPEHQRVLRAAGGTSGDNLPLSDIFAAARKGTAQDVQHFISSGTSVHLTDDMNGWTPLHYAVSRGGSDIGVVEYLISQGADVDAGDSTRCTPLHYAVNGRTFLVAMELASYRGQQSGAPPNMRVLEALISHGADINARDYGGETPLHHVTEVANPNMEVLRYLVSKGANVNEQDGGKRTPLHFAARNRYSSNVEALRYLISVQDADINVRDSQGRTPLDSADTEAKREILRTAGGKSGSEL